MLKNKKKGYQFGHDVVGLQSPPIRHAYMTEIVKYYLQDCNSQPIRLLEIGSWVGSSTITWAKALSQSNLKVEIFCVDPWKPYFDTNLNIDEHYKLMNNLAMDKKVLDIFKNNIQHAGISHLIQSHQGTNTEILPTFPDCYFDIIYIDGSHLYEDVTYDIVQAKRLIKDHGIICGDDLEQQLSDVNLDIHNTALKTGKDFILNELTNKSYHPGVTQAVHEQFLSIGVFEGLWSIQKQNESWICIELPEKITLKVPEHLTTQPYFINEYKNFNLFKYNDEICCIRQAIGQVDISESKKNLINRHKPHDLFFEKNINDAEYKITAILEIESQMEKDVQ